MVSALDDNTSHKNSPIMLSLVYTFRLLGPTLGYMLSGFCLTTYVYPSQEVAFDEKDMQWIGAWWLGFPIIGCLIVAFAGKIYSIKVLFDSNIYDCPKPEYLAGVGFGPE